MTAKVGTVQIGGLKYPNSWIPEGRNVRLIICKLCLDTGTVLDDDLKPAGPCDCTRGWAQAEAERVA